MRQRTTTLLTSTFLLAVSAAQAQTSVSIGPLLGLNGTSGPSRGSWTISPRVGAEVGVQSVLQVGHLAVQPSLRFSQKGWYESLILLMTRVVIALIT